MAEKSLSAPDVNLPGAKEVGAKKNWSSQNIAFFIFPVFSQSVHVYTNVRVQYKLE